MLLAQIIRGQLTENLANSIARNIRLNLDKTLWIKMILYRSLNKCLFQFGKGLFCFGDEEQS